MATIFRSIWASLIWLFLLLIPVQFYLAGRGAFAFHDAAALAREDAWAAHVSLGWFIVMAALLTLLAGLPARLTRRLLGLTLLLCTLIVIQSVLPGFGDNSSTRWVAALHPVNALILTGTVIMLAARARPYLPIARFRQNPRR